MDAPSRLARRLAVLPEVAMREAVLLEVLAALPPARAVEELAGLLAGAQQGRQPEYVVALTALAGALGRLPYVLRQGLYEAAKAAVAVDVARLFFAAPPRAEPPPPEPEQYVPGAGRALTLGERKALARGGRRDALAALVRDPDAAVIKSLLANPRLTERDVLAVASRRPVRGDVLQALFESRWLARYHVKRALVLNPHTPGDLAIRLVGTLVAADLRMIAADGNLAAPVRAQARVILHRARPAG